MNRVTTIELSKEYMKFSAAHFTIFSAVERERLHGHNFQVSAEITLPVGSNGMCCNYRVYKQKLDGLCRELDEYLLIPARSPHLTVREEGDYYWVRFNGEEMPFLKADTQLLPICNTTVEDFSNFLLQKLVGSSEELQEYGVYQIVVRVSSGPGQSGSSQWRSGSAESWT
ncbi:6-pyruvoyl trahydropterin synthase family protein [Microbulbifer taiwanensis]|uniref:6-carboxy-5,6,7,8-tetrahydropterin synthase n=1 Tax=Microbulbifer taiwanensis TaxID=986746 RepID=A0ABW1YR64_9GAMM|nr:6-carboxytetrahydropterin synthase [Microbulbifer taiwanensis]